MAVSEETGMARPMTTIHVVRHGEVDNPTGELYGRQDGFHLTALGREMAKKVAEYFIESSSDIRLIMSSPLERAQETAQPTAQYFELPIVSDQRLIEAGNKFEGINVNKNRLILAHPRFWPWYTNPFEPSWGEPYTHIAQRMVSALAYARQRAEGGQAVIVSHQLPIWTLRNFLNRAPLAHDPRKRECSLCSITSVHFLGSQLMSISYHEPARDLLIQARDITPGTSSAAENTGN